MTRKKIPGLWVEVGVYGKVCVLMVGEGGREGRLPPIDPAKNLIAASALDCTAYRREIQRLYDEHPLFEERLGIPESDLEDLSAEALTLPSMLQEIDPLSFFGLGNLLDQALRMRDDGSVSFLLHAGQRLLQTLEIPIRIQIRLHNIMEMTFDEMERATQQERYEKLCGVYPQIAQICDSGPWKEEAMPVTFEIESIYKLRLSEFMLYFRQEKKRISWCSHCWNYFIPRTRAEKRYCDRVLEGQSCKKRGANLKRKKGLEQDGALRLFKQLRDRMCAKMFRYGDAPESQRKKLIPLMVLQYGEWEENARQMRREYMAEKIKAEEFLRRIDTTHELVCYDTVK